MGLLSKGVIAQVKDLTIEEVEVPEWGGSVRVRTMTGADRDAFENSMVTADAKGNRKAEMSNMRAKLCAMTLVDDAGNPMFATSKEGIDFLSGKSAAALDRIFKVAQRLNGLGVDAIEDAGKNSLPEASGSSTSA
jgi:hypothetical protein